MKSWLPPNVPMAVWDGGKLLHFERVDDADCRATYTMGAGDTRAYRFHTDRWGMVIGVEVWCDGCLETSWKRLQSRDPHDVQWGQVNAGERP